jgi:hypothetical protein
VPDVICELADVGNVSAVLDPGGVGFVAGLLIRLQASSKRSAVIKKYNARIFFIRVFLFSSTL